MNLKITSWNINSVRLRISLVEKFLREHQPDVLCLQETKCRDSEFPFSNFRKLGYEHIAIHGQKGYHGVATISRIPFGIVDRKGFCDKGDCRHISVELAVQDPHQPITLHNFYIPAGGDEPDPEVNEKFAHKLQFLDELAHWTESGSLAANHAVLVGDLNIAPLETDVWSHKSLLSVVSHTPIEVEKLQKAFSSGPWVDALRTKIPPAEKLFTWWSYRSPNWEAANKGRRLDHIWLSQSLESSLAGVEVLKEARGWERPSDHVPVSAMLNLRG